MIRDITRRLRPGFPEWPGDPPFELDRVSLIAEGHLFDVSRVTLSVHTGSHLDAPSHVIRGGGDVSSIDLGALIGPARVLHVPGAGRIEIQDLLAEGARPGGEISLPPYPRILIRTQSAESFSAPPNAFAALSDAAAQGLVRSGARLVGIDTPSVDPIDAAEPTVHRCFARAGVAVLEGLDLRDVPAGEYVLVALPLSLEGAEGAPVRAILLDGSDLSSLAPAGGGGGCPGS